MYKSNITAISTSGVAVATDNADITNARIEFENGCVANLTASRVSLKKMRKTRIFQKDAYVSIDFLEKNTEIVSLSEESSWNPFVMNIEVDADGNSVNLDKIKKLNAIQEELVSFAKAIQSNSLPLVSLNDDGCKLYVAHTIMEKINERITKTLPNAENFLITLVAVVLVHVQKINSRLKSHLIFKFKSIDLETDSFEGSDSQNLTDAWVTMDGKFLGAFELPCTIPILSDGTREFRVSGIKAIDVSTHKPLFIVRKYFDLFIKDGDTYQASNSILP